MIDALFAVMRCSSVPSIDTSAGRAFPGIHHLQTSFFQRPVEKNESPPATVSRLCQQSATELTTACLPSGTGLSMNWFVALARQYRLSGEPASVLCEHNADVASRAKRDEVAQTWRMLGIMVPVVPSVGSSSTLVPPTMSQTTTSHLSSQPQMLLAPVMVTVSGRGK